MTAPALPLRTRQIITRLPRTTAVLTPLSDPPRIIVASRNGAKVAQANPDAIVLDREAACLRRNLIRRSMRTERVRRLTEFVLRALPKTEVDRMDARRASGITADDNFSLCLRQVHHNLKPFGIGVASAYGGRVVIIGQESASC